MLIQYHNIQAKYSENSRFSPSLPPSQVPLGVLTALPFMKGQIGNSVVWTSIILGQPVAILMYMHDYYLIHSVNITMATTD